jgi:uncharacterized protein YyaL (SSP411 family)
MRALEAFAGRINETPYAAPLMAAAYELSRSASKQVVLAGEDLDAMLRVFYSKFLPHHVLIRGKAGMPAVEGKTTAYVCENFTCNLPVTDPAQFEELLQ